MSLLGLMVLGAPAHHHLHRPPPGRGRPHGPHGPHGPPGPHGPHGPGGGHRGPGRRPAPRPPWAPRPGGDCDYDNYDYDADYAATDYASPEPDYESGKPGVPPALAKCGAAARALEMGCEDAFVRVARGVRRGDIAPEDAAAKFESVARGCEAKLEALVAKCADAFAPPDDDDDDDDARSSSDDATKKACDAAAAAMEMPCVDEPAGAMRALEAGAMSAETAARTLGESAVSCADAAAAAETACAL